RKIFCGDWQLGHRPGREPDGDLSYPGQIKERGMAVTIVHPGNENIPKAATPPPRLVSLAGKKIGLLDISKPGGSFFLDRMEELLRTRYGAAEVVRTRKPTYTKNAPSQIIEQLRGMDAVIEGLAD